jgi:hypothetical protein
MRDHRPTDEKPPFPERATAFLQTTTGLVTGVAALLAAVVGLVTAVTQLRGDNGEPVGGAAAAATTTAGLPEDPTDAELWSHIPVELRPTCRRSTDAEPRSVSAYNCTYRRTVGLQYNLFSSGSELAAGYDEMKQRYGLAAAVGTSCREGGFEGEYVPGGSLLCFVGDDGVAAIVWTDDELDVMSFAWRDDGNLPALYDAWREGVGPVR